MTSGLGGGWPRWSVGTDRSACVAWDGRAGRDRARAFVHCAGYDTLPIRTRSPAGRRWPSRCLLVSAAVPGLVAGARRARDARRRPTAVDGRRAIRRPIVSSSTRGDEPDGSSLASRTTAVRRSPTATVDPEDDTRMVATPTAPLDTGDYKVESTGGRDDGHVERTHLDLHRRRRPDAVAHAIPPRRRRRAERVDTRRPTPADTRPVGRPDPVPSADGGATRERQRRPPADHRRPDRPGRRGAYLLSRRNRPDPTSRRLATRGSGRGRARGPDRRRVGWPPSGLASVLARRRSRRTASTRRTRAACRSRSTWSAPPRRSPCRSSSSSSATSGRPRPTSTPRARCRRPGSATRSVPSASLGWAWIIAQGIAGGSSDGDVATLFLWVYGWVGVAILCAIIGPVWHFLDPFSTLHDLGAAVLRRLGVQGWAIADYPAALGRWPAAIGFAFFVWLELVLFAGAVDPVHRARRLHGADAGDDGPVRAGRMALARRDLHGLVPAARPARAIGAWSTRTGASAAARSGAGCSSRAGRRPT